MSHLRSLLLLLSFSALSLSGCSKCKLPTNAALPVCMLESNLIQCGEQDGYALVPLVLEIVGGLVSGQPFDAGKLVSELESQGIKDVPCVLAALEQYVSGGKIAHKAELQAAFHKSLAQAVAKKGMRGEVSIKLKRGEAIKVLVP